MKLICKILDIAYEDSLLLPTRNGSPWEGNSMHGTSFKGVSASSVGRYKKKGDRQEIAEIERNLSDYLDRFGYSSDAGHSEFKNEKYGVKGLRLKFFFWLLLRYKFPQLLFYQRNLISYLVNLKRGFITKKQWLNDRNRIKRFIR